MLVVGNCALAVNIEGCVRPPSSCCPPKPAIASALPPPLSPSRRHHTASRQVVGHRRARGRRRGAARSTMSRFTSLFSSGFLGSAVSAQSRTTDGLTRLRFTLETLPGSKKYVFTQATRSEILAELYGTFCGSHIHSFLPESRSGIPAQALLSEVQAHCSLNDAGSAEIITPGRCCSHIFSKGESCYRCKLRAIQLFLNP